MTFSARILVIDDDDLVREFIEEALRRQGYIVHTADSAEEGLRLVADQSFDLVFTDVRMPGASGLDVLRRVRERFPETMVILVTAFGNVEMAVEAMKAGAFEFLLKPCTPEQIEMVAARALELRKLRTENELLRCEQMQRQSRDEIVGHSRPMGELFKLMSAAAPQDSTVLITGESGTGKELIARAIYFGSRRADGPWVSFNCAAVPDNLIESELFGHEKGAFTGAVKTTRGRFEAADRGTLLLDEIGEMPLPLQAKLLRVLQSREFERVGSTDPIQVDVRIIATTNRSLEEEVARGTFRPDLFYRLNVISLRVPPLRERRADVPMLLQHFIQLFAERTGKAVTGIENSAVQMLQGYTWDGNVRELSNAIERAVVLTENKRLTRDDFEMRFQLGGAQSESFESNDSFKLKEMEKRYIIRALERTGGNRSKAAEMLGIAPRTLRNKINDYQLRSRVPDSDEAIELAEELAD